MVANIADNLQCVCSGFPNGTNGIPISFKVLPMVPLVIPFVPMAMPMVPLAPNGTIGKITNGTIGRTPNRASVVKITNACKSHDQIWRLKL